MNSTLLTLQKCSLFKNKSLSEIEYLLSNISYTIKDFLKNEIVFSYKKTADTLGILLSGCINVQKLFPSGKVVTITTRDIGDLIADASIFSKAQYYPSTIYTCVSSKILFISKTELLKLFSLDEDIIINFLESVSNRALTLNQKIEILSLNSIKERIAFFLLKEYTHNKSYKITLPFSKKIWAEYMNVSRSSLSRELKELCIKDILSFKERTITIINLDALKEILSDV